MRLDKYLKVSRLIKRRTIANEACDERFVSVNGRPTKAGHQVCPGDIIELNFGAKTLKVEVIKVEENVSKAEASALYREIE